MVAFLNESHRVTLKPHPRTGELLLSTLLNVNVDLGSILYQLVPREIQVTELLEQSNVWDDSPRDIADVKTGTSSAVHFPGKNFRWELASGSHELKVDDQGRLRFSVPIAINLEQFLGKQSKAGSATMSKACNHQDRPSTNKQQFLGEQSKAGSAKDNQRDFPCTGTWENAVREKRPITRMKNAPLKKMQGSTTITGAGVAKRQSHTSVGCTSLAQGWLSVESSWLTSNRYQTKDDARVYIILFGEALEIPGSTSTNEIYMITRRCDNV